jgi:hypothetical protein
MVIIFPYRSGAHEKRRTAKREEIFTAALVIYAGKKIKEQQPLIRKITAGLRTIDVVQDFR